MVSKPSAAIKRKRKKKKIKEEENSKPEDGVCVLKGEKTGVSDPNLRNTCTDSKICYSEN